MFPVVWDLNETGLYADEVEPKCALVFLFGVWTHVTVLLVNYELKYEPAGV